jgi:hypothetical protein
MLTEWDAGFLAGYFYGNIFIFIGFILIKIKERKEERNKW